VAVIALRPMIERYGRWCEYIYAIGLIFALTQGPVYKIWRTAELYTPIPISPTWHATFVLIQIPALMLLTRRGLRKEFVSGPLIVLTVFLGWMLISLIWTNLSRYVLIDALALAISAGAGLYVGSRFSSRQIVQLVMVAMQFGVTLSLIAAVQSWSESIDAEGNWTGIYFNRNSLGPVAMIALVTGLIVMVSLWRAGKTPSRIVSALVFVVLLPADVVVYVKSGSGTSFGAVVAATVAALIWITIGKWYRRTDAPLKAIQQIVFPSFVCFSLLAAWIGFRYQDQIVRLFGKSDSFSGRSALWHFSWTGFLDRPVLGWGWRAAWSTPEFLKRDKWWTTSGATWSHNAYLEILLGGGIIGGLLFSVFVLWAGTRIMKLVVSDPFEIWRIGMSVFVLVASTQEVFVIGNHFLWLLLVAVLTPPLVNRLGQRLEVEHHQT
jgi:exopolysaccharide production protein ExoQ